MKFRVPGGWIKSGVTLNLVSFADTLSIVLHRVPDRDESLGDLICSVHDELEPT